jgi:hypothetical protein
VYERNGRRKRSDREGQAKRETKNKLSCIFPGPESGAVHRALPGLNLQPLLGVDAALAWMHSGVTVSIVRHEQQDSASFTGLRERYLQNVRHGSEAVLRVLTLVERLEASHIGQKSSRAVRKFALARTRITRMGAR